MNKEVSIIVLNFNGKSFLENCLKSIKEQTYSNISTYVIDNNSTDGSQKYVNSLGWSKLISNQENLGYAEANNIGAIEATGEFLLILNNDTELFKDAVENLVKSYRSNYILAPSQILMSERGVDFEGVAGNGVDIFGYPFMDKDRSKTKIFYADGAGIFIKKSDFIEIGMFDKKLFIFQEDIDLSWRAQMMGYKIERCIQAKLYHYSGGFIVGGQKVNKERRYVTSYYRRYLNEKNVIRNILKNYSFPLCFFILVVLLMLHAVEILGLMFMRKLCAARCYIDAYIWNIMNIKDTLKYRRQVQAKRIVSDFELMKRMYFSYSKLVAVIRLGVPIFK